MSAEAIAKKNDELRSKLPALPWPHRLILSSEVAALDMIEIGSVITSIKEYNNFTEENDPYEEHDCIIVGGCICKIDYYDDDFEYFKEDGNRVFTIMKSHEY